jgi:AraC-like DNA-binding protein
MKNLHNDPFPVSTIIRLIIKFEETGSVIDLPRSGRPSLSESEIQIVKESVEKCKEESAGGKCSVRAVSQECGISKSCVHRIMKEELHLHPYKPSFVQELVDGDAERRVEFAELFLSTIAEHSENILWTDEAHFLLRGEVSSLCGYVWSEENPMFVWRNRCILKK